MKQILVMMAAMVLVGCGTTKVDPNAPANINDPIVEKAVRIQLEKPEGELTNADLGNVIGLGLNNTQITDAGLKEVAKLRKLEVLSSLNTKVSTAGVLKLKKALPNCRIFAP